MSATTTWSAFNAITGNDPAPAPPGIAVNDTPFFGCGVCYSPVPWGGDSNWEPYGDFMFPPWNAIWERDLPAMRKAGINMIRTYNIVETVNGVPHDHTDFFNACWNDGNDPIYVMIGYGDLNNLATYQPWASSAGRRAAVRAAFLSMAAAYADFPAVMGFILGNEVNNANTIVNPDFWQWIDALAVSAKEAAPGKLTMMSLVDDSMNSVVKGDQYVPNLDMWGINSYRGAITPSNANNFNNLWSSFQAASTKPLMLSEWGAPASSHDANGNLVFTGSIVADLNTYVTGHYNDITSNAVSTTGNGGTGNPNSANWAPVCVGSAYFEWTDEWWKLDAAYPNVNCPATVQNPGLSANGAFPGGWGDEECFGLNAIEPAGPDPKGRPGPGGAGCPGPWNFGANAPYPPDILHPRASLATLTPLWKAS